MLLSFPQDRPPKVHFMGIGGTGMVSAARLAIEAGWEVRGSDGPLYPPTSELVKNLGVPVATGYAAENLDWAPDVVVIGNAMTRGNPEVEAALDQHLHYVSMPEWLKDAVLRKRRPVVIAGTHGKTTTTALTAFLLDRAGRNPGFLIGGQALDFPNTARIGVDGGPFVVEGDEYDTAFFDKRAKFLHYLPQIAVVTSIEFDHGDIYRDIEEIETAFQRMLRQIPSTGHLVLCADSFRAVVLRDHALCNVTTYGFSDDADWRIHPGRVENGLQRFRLTHQGDSYGEFRSPLIGNHNLQNAAAAIVVESLYGAPGPEPVIEALPQFRGIRRRMEVFHEAGGITFVDDFAHHPTAIRETIAAARTRWPKRRILVAFEPRSNTTVTSRFQNELRDSFREADALWLGPIYRFEKYDPKILLDRAKLTKELPIPATYWEAVLPMLNSLKAEAKEGDVVLILSNGAFGGIYQMVKDIFA